METVTVSALAGQKDDPVRSQWIDVCSATEFAAGHLPGAINIPMDEIEARLHDLSPERPIVLVCKSGGRARMVAELLEPCRKKVRRACRRHGRLEQSRAAASGKQENTLVARAASAAGGRRACTRWDTSGRHGEPGLACADRVCRPGADVCRAYRLLSYGRPAGRDALEPY